MLRNSIRALVLVLLLAGVANAHGTKNKELISPTDLASAIGTFHILDVRSAEDFTQGHVPGALSLPISEISDNRLKSLGLEAASQIVLYGVSESSPKKAKLLLDILGYSQIRILAGGYTHWVEDGQTIVKGAPPRPPGTTTTSLATNLEILPESYDFGVIGKSDGVVSTVFIVRNISDKELSITEITTSCGCTTAEMDEELIPPGKERSLTVYFDPNFHKEPEGKFSRTVFLQTSNSQEILANIEVEINNE